MAETRSFVLSVQPNFFASVVMKTPKPFAQRRTFFSFTEYIFLPINLWVLIVYQYRYTMYLYYIDTLILGDSMTKSRSRAAKKAWNTRRVKAQRSVAARKAWKT